MAAFFHHSRYLAYRRPFGALPCGAVLTLCCDLAMPEDTAVFARFWQEGESERLVPMRREGDRVRCEVTMPDAPCLVWYFFVLRTGDGHTLYYGGAGGEGGFYKHEPPAWQLTVYDGAFTTPRSFCEGVAYQIFPDRFKRSSWEDFRSRAQYHIWRGRHVEMHDRWSDPPLDRPSTGRNEYDPVDYFGGDLNGIIEKLPYLASMGVTYLYLNPVFEAASNHRYNTADYRKIDPILGTNEDFARLCSEAKQLGIRVMLDGVFSHTGSDSRYFNQDARYPDRGACQGTDSPYYEWYRFSQYPDAYECWWGFPTLPNVTELTPSYTAFIAGEDGVLAHWARLGATSWRLDVADELPDEFIRILRSRIKALDPEGVLLGEVWEDCSNKFVDGVRRDYTDGNELDAAMNYPFGEAVVAFLTQKSDAYALTGALGTLREHYPKPLFDASLNLFSSHDEVRMQTRLSGAPARTALPREAQARWQPTPEDARLGRIRTVLATAVQMTFPGVPCVYYGDEAGMLGMADPYNRATYPWGKEDKALREAFRALMLARRDTPALKRGLCRFGALGPDVFSIVRYGAGDGGCAVLLVNRSIEAREAVLCEETLPEGPDAETPMPLFGRFTEVLTGETRDFSGKICLTLPPLSAALYISAADLPGRGTD